MKRIWMMMLLLPGGFIACVDTSNLDYLASIVDSDRDSDSRRRIGRRRFSRSSNQCENSERCEDICDQILDYSKERRNCYGLSLKEIGKVEDVFDKLKNPTEAKLEDIKGGDFDLFASLALASWSNLIRGEYRRDERGDDDDEDGDDYEDFEYDATEAKNVLNYVIDNKSIAESIRDFSERDQHIIEDLLVNMGEGLTCSGSGDDEDICDALDSSNSSLTDGEKSILAGIKSTRDDYNPSARFLWWIVNESNSDDEVSAIYELTHDVLSRACDNVGSVPIDGKNYGSDRLYKICLSWVYFCPSNSNSPAVYGSVTDKQIDQYLLEDTYRSSVESSLKGCTFLTTEPKWSDYWN